MRRGFGRNRKGQEGNILSWFFGTIVRSIETILGVAIIAIFIISILAMAGLLDNYGLGGYGRGLNNILWNNRIVGPMIASAKEMKDEALTPAKWEEEKADTTTSTETKPHVGITLVNDPKEHTGIFSTSPYSGQEHTILAGVKNPTKDFIAGKSKLVLANPDRVQNKTGLTFTQFTWDTGGTEKDIDIFSYFSANAKSTPPGEKAKVVLTPEEAGATYVNMEVDYSYDFKAKAPMGKTGTAANEFILYEAKFDVCPSAQLSEKEKENLKNKYKVVDRGAGVPITATRTVVDACIAPGGTLTLAFTLQMLDLNPNVFEVVDLKGGPTTDKIVLVVPKILEKNTEKLDCTPIPGTENQNCKIKDLLANSNLKTLQKRTCGLDGCVFNKYDSAQGFTAASKILTDEADSDEMYLMVSFKAPTGLRNDENDTVYSIYLMMLDDAFTYHAAMVKLIGVQT